MGEDGSKADNVGSTHSFSQIEASVEAQMNPPWYAYIFTNRCGRGTFFFLLGASIASLIVLSATNPEEFMRIMKIPISDYLQFPLSATIGLIILGSLMISVLICYIKNGKEEDKDLSSMENFIKFLNSRTYST